MLSVAWENTTCLCMPSARKQFVSANFHAMLLVYCYYIFAKIIITENILQILVPGYYFVQLRIGK